MKHSKIPDQQTTMQHVVQRIRDIITTFAIKHVSPGIQVSPRLKKTIQAFFTAFEHLNKDETQSEIDRVLGCLKVPLHDVADIHVPICSLPSLYPLWFNSYVTIRQGNSPIVVGLIDSLGGLPGFGLASLQYWEEEGYYTLDMCCYPHFQVFHWNIDNDPWRIYERLEDPSSDWFPALCNRDDSFAEAAKVHFVPASRLHVLSSPRESDEGFDEPDLIQIYLQELATVSSARLNPPRPTSTQDSNPSGLHCHGVDERLAVKNGHAIGPSTTFQPNSSMPGVEQKTSSNDEEELQTEKDQSDQDDHGPAEAESTQASKADKKREAQRQRRMKKRKLRSGTDAEGLSLADLMALRKQEPLRC